MGGSGTNYKLYMAKLGINNLDSMRGGVIGEYALSSYINGETM
jgi:hypothetical protein